MRKHIPYKLGDKVFAKLKGYPAWPAQITSVNSRNFSVQFYGTGEMGSIKSEDLYYYLKYKYRYGKPLKRKDFNDAMAEIERDVQAAGGDGNEQSSISDQTNDSVLSNNSTLNSTLNDSIKRKLSHSTADDSSLPPAKIIKTASVEGADISSQLEPQNIVPTEENKDKSTGNDTDAPKPGDQTASVPSPEADKEIGENVPNAIPDAITDDQMQRNSPETDITKMEILSEDNLKAIIAYAKHVQEKAEFYKAKSVERVYHQNEVVPVRLPSPITTDNTATTNQIVRHLKVHKQWPLSSFANEYDSAVYDGENAEKLLALKQSLETGSEIDRTTPNDDDVFVVKFDSIDESTITAAIEARVNANKIRIVQRLKVEADVVDLDAKIKICLGLQKADAHQALEYLDQFMNYRVDELMLKKHPHIVGMVRRLRKYVGNVEEWDLEPASIEQFKSNADKIRKKSGLIYDKFKEVVNLPEGTTNFWDGFNALATEFKDLCKDLSDHENMVLCAEPQSRQAFMDLFEVSKDLVETELRSKDGEEETDKENPPSEEIHLEENEGISHDPIEVEEEEES